jgi:hypothetical protein
MGSNSRAQQSRNGLVVVRDCGRYFASLLAEQNRYSTDQCIDVESEFLQQIIYGAGWQEPIRDADHGYLRR